MDASKDISQPEPDLSAAKVSDSVWYVPCTVNKAHNEYSPLLKPIDFSQRVRSRHTWSTDEDSVLRALVQTKGPRRWNSIAKDLNTQLYQSRQVRQGKQCRERWYNHLSPTLRKEPWSVEEDIFIIEQQIKLGNRWSEIAKSLVGRTENCVKNRWKCMLKKAVRRSPAEADCVQRMLDAKYMQRMTDLKQKAWGMFSNVIGSEQRTSANEVLPGCYSMLCSLMPSISPSYFEGQYFMMSDSDELSKS
jgi:hypothetical protein